MLALSAGRSPRGRDLPPDRQASRKDDSARGREREPSVLSRSFAPSASHRIGPANTGVFLTLLSSFITVYQHLPGTFPDTGVIESTPTCRVRPSPGRLENLPFC